MERTLITVPSAISMISVVGPADSNLRVIESAFPNVSMTVRGNEISLRGDAEECNQVENLFHELLVVIRSGQQLTPDAVTRAISMLRQIPQDHPGEVLSLNIVSNRGRTIRPENCKSEALRRCN
jgi:phosphate starvation-inducible PhoH-like protein